MREEGQVIKKIDSHGLDNTRGPIIISKSNKSWSYSQKKLFRVQKGDIFSYQLWTKLNGDNVSASAGIAAFDEYQTNISWNYIFQEIKVVGHWIQTTKAFTVDDDVEFIRFKLSGTGQGEFRFDNVQFIKNSL